MKIQDAKKLAPGDEVYWNDPDEGICSRFYIISKIEIEGNVISITSDDGNYLDCFVWELS
jgi:hypothetical protein